MRIVFPPPATAITGTVANFSALPDAALHENQLYRVLAAQGVIFVNRKPAGIYDSDGATWSYVSDFTENDQAGEISFDPTGLPVLSGATVQAALAQADSGLNIVLTTAPGLTIDGAGSVPATGSQGFITFPYACTITKWYMSADQTGSAVIDIKHSGVSIVGTGNKPTLAAAQSGNAAPSGWTSVAIAADDIIEYNLDSVATITKLSMILKVRRS